ncbi:MULTISPECIES: hypothetical protein [Dysgonomonas]|uniref:Uncharacterized protein n=2 Tax=Dysgonomonas gadei TaxID=156974 RepID=F5ISY4_9BACT|nr:MULTISPECIES: hypothetical protein [Dysgonomonas]EGK01161.1 hypothetical protein HMPREF9455_00201 [Dysgonomonas gadei ATCC BAA-286]MBF0647770.1 hypothetical protein [Dysgonomonas sp. GY75]
MKKIYLFGLIFTVISVSCQKKQINLYETQLNPLKVDLADISLNSSSSTIDLTKIQRLTPEQYSSLQLEKVKGLEGYELSDLCLGQILLENKNGKILTIQVVTDGEITEYLLSYDKNGNMIDNLIVAYEDMVEYYSEVSSKIKSNEIIVQTINYTYDEINSDSGGTADTAITKYQISPEFKFISN